MQFQSPSQTIGAIIRGFKGAATKQANEYLEDLTAGSIWQRNYYDHIITTTKSLERISNYIYINPINWKADINNPEFMSGVSQKQREVLLKKHHNELFS